MEVRDLTGGAAAAGGGSVTVEMMHHLWADWTRVGVKHLHGARDARSRVFVTRSAGGNWAEDMADEYQDSLVAVSASAHALDAAYGGLKPLVAMPTLAENSSRHDFIRTALSAGYRLGNEVTSRWKQEFTWLFDLRDAAVHHFELSRPTVPHPIEGHGSYEVARYCLETSERAVALALDVLTVMASPNLARSEPVRQRSTGMVVLVEDLVAQAARR